MTARLADPPQPPPEPPLPPLPPLPPAPHPSPPLPPAPRTVADHGGTDMGALGITLAALALCAIVLALFGNWS